MYPMYTYISRIPGLIDQVRTCQHGVSSQYPGTKKRRRDRGEATAWQPHPRYWLRVILSMDMR